MKHFILFLSLSTTVFFLPLFATKDSVKLFENANKLYSESNFSKALTEYKSIEPKTSHIFYNMGNSAYRLGNKGKALLYWRKAEKLGGIAEQSDLIENLEMVGKEPFFSGIPYFYLQLLFLLLVFLLCIYLKIYPHFCFKTIVFIFTILIFLTSIFMVAQGIVKNDTCVVVLNNASVLSGPGLGFQIITTIKETDEVIFLKESFGYYKVRINGTSGWIDRKNAEIV